MNPLQWLILEGGPAVAVPAFMLTMYALGLIMRALDRREIRRHLRRRGGF